MPAHLSPLGRSQPEPPRASPRAPRPTDRRADRAGAAWSASAKAFVDPGSSDYWRLLPRTACRSARGRRTEAYPPAPGGSPERYGSEASPLDQPFVAIEALIGAREDGDEGDAVEPAPRSRRRIGDPTPIVESTEEPPARLSGAACATRNLARRLARMVTWTGR